MNKKDVVVVNGFAVITGIALNKGTRLEKIAFAKQNATRWTIMVNKKGDRAQVVNCVTGMIIRGLEGTTSVDDAYSINYFVRICGQNLKK